MLKGANRLRRKKDIERIVKKGKSVFDPVCGIRFLPNGLVHSRFAVVVGTKVHKRAVKRNRVKRQYREVLRLNLEHVAPGYDIVLFTSSKALDLTYMQKQDGIVHVLKKANLWQN